MNKFIKRGTCIGLVFGILLCLSQLVLAEGEVISGDDFVVSSSSDIYESNSQTYIVRDGKATGETLGGALVYDPVENVLTINEVASDINLDVVQMGYFFTINIPNNITLYNSKLSVNVYGNLTIVGDGSLTSTMSKDNNASIRLYAKQDMNIKGGSISSTKLGETFIVEGTYTQTGGSIYMKSYSGDPLSTKNAVFKGGCFTAEGSQAIKYSGNVEIADGLSAKAGFDKDNNEIIDSYINEQYLLVAGDVIDNYKENIPDGDVTYRTQVENVGWQDWHSNGKMSGTEGQNLRLEGIQISTSTEDIGIQYVTHIQNIGWEDEEYGKWKANGEMSGTEGKGLRLEAIRIKLTGKKAELYDVYYRVHTQNLGWLGWAKNGEDAGTAGLCYRLEGIEIMVLPSGTTPDGYVGDTEAFVEGVKVSFLTWRWKEYYTVYLIKGSAVSPPVDPVQSNRHFAGWFADSSHTIPWNFSAPVEKNMNLWSDWAYTGEGEDTEWNIPDGDSTGSDGGAIFTGEYTDE